MTITIQFVAALVIFLVLLVGCYMSQKFYDAVVKATYCLAATWLAIQLFLSVQTK